DILPLLLDGTPLPNDLAAYQWIDLRKEDFHRVYRKPVQSPIGQKPYLRHIIYLMLFAFICVVLQIGLLHLIWYLFPTTMDSWLVELISGIIVLIGFIVGLGLIFNLIPVRLQLIRRRNFELPIQEDNSSKFIANALYNELNTKFPVV
ncbi:MAG: hypothetical protein M3342_02245, partial [Bacteroidota bacterium]|nr:hypothetical protein [Bacteroidota bacterium]